MFGFLEKGREFNKLALSIGALFNMVNELNFRIKDSTDTSQFHEEVLVLAYISKRGIFDRIEKNNWSLDSKISIPAISSSRITLSYGLSKSVFLASILASNLGIKDLYDDVLNEGEHFKTLDKILPSEFKQNF